MIGDMSELAADALAALARECPHAHAAMRAALGDRRIQVTTAREVFDVANASVAPPSNDAALAVRTTAAALHAVVTGELDLVAAVTTDRIEVRGRPDDVIAAAHGMTRFLEGALRCASMTSLRDRLAAIAEGEVS